MNRNIVLFWLFWWFLVIISISKCQNKSTFTCSDCSPWFEGEDEVRCLQLEELESTNFQSHSRSSYHTGWFCLEAYNGKSLLWYKPWKSDVSPVALPVSGTAHSSTCSAWQPAILAPCKSIWFAHGSQWEMGDEGFAGMGRWVLWRHASIFKNL